MRNFWLSALSKSLSRRAKRQRPTARLTVETMEDRIVPTLTWSSGISLPYAQTSDVALKESNQSLLVLGGTTSVNQLALDATAWTSANSLDAARVSPGIASIGSGQILVYGGSGFNTALVYDPSNSSNTHYVASMSTVHSLMAFATDGSNRAYAIGGLDSSNNRLTTVERYDPSSGAWSTLAALPTALSGAAAVYDGAGDIFVFGGATNSASNSTTALEYSVANDSWTTVASMPSSTTEAAAVMGPNGLIYVMGGKNSDGSQRSAVKVYNPTTNGWSSDTSLPVPLSDEAAVVDPQNRIEVIGGTALGDDPYSSSAVYVTQTLANYAPIITTTSLPSATVGTQYTTTVTAIGMPAPTFSIDADSQSLGMSINASTGVLSWAPTTIGSYSVTVQAQNSVGTATQTYTLLVTTDITPPTAPVVTMQSISSTSSITLNWTPSSDNVGVAGYRIYAYTPGYWSGHSGKGGGYTWHPPVFALLVDNISPSTSSYTLTGLSPDTTYNYVMTAFDAAGNESVYSNAVTGTTWEVPSITWYFNYAYNSPISIVANHQLSFGVYAAGNPTPTLSLSSAPGGVVYSNNTITWTPTASQVGVNDIIMQATNSAGSTTLDIPVTVTADVPVPSLTVNGGYTYTTGNMTTGSGSNDYLLTLNPAFGNPNTNPQFGFVGTTFSFQFGGTANTNPITYALVNGPATMTINATTGVGSWTPGYSDASAATNVTVSATNSVGTTDLTFTFPTYFTTAPTNVVVGFYASVSGAAPTTYTPIVTWTPPTNTTGIADYQVDVTSALTNVTTVYDTQSTATSFALPLGITGQNWVNVTALDANGNPSETSTSNAPLYVAALTSLSWNYSSSTVNVGQAMSVQYSALYSTYAIMSAPAGATINSTTGLLSWTPTAAQVGTAQITASANDGWGPVYTTLTFQVVTATTTTITDNGPNPSASGQAVSFTVQTSGGVPDGETINLEDASNGNAVVGTGTLTGGSATIDVSSLSVGTHDLFAVYGGDSSYASSQSTQVVQVVNFATTTTPSIDQAGPYTTTSSLTFTATITGNPSVGTVTFYADPSLTNQIGSPVAVVNGTADSSPGYTFSAGSNTVTAVYSGGSGFAGSQGTITFQVNSAAPPPSITNVVINQDLSALYNAAGQPSPGVQRSMVDDVVYTFSEPVNILDPVTNPNVFTVAVASGWTGTSPTLSWAPVAGTGNTEWAVSFSGDSVSGGSIATGAYAITVTDPASITAVSDSQALSVTPGQAPAAGNPDYATQAFFRLYADINGDATVNASDNAKFKQALTSYNSAFDFNNDGNVNAFDNAKFKNELTVSFSGFTATI